MRHKTLSAVVNLGLVLCELHVSESALPSDVAMTEVRRGAAHKRAVYGAYRDLLSSYGGRAADILDAKPDTCLTHDLGVGHRIAMYA